MNKSVVKLHSYSQLPSLSLKWLSLKDHFIATVGPSSGQGRPLGNLLVLADATFQAQSRFPQHPHKDMEILTWVVKGVLQHYDDNGTDQSVPEKSLQLMSARDGIFHAEGNATNEEVRMLQIWINPQNKGGTPLVQQTSLEGNGFQCLAAPEGAPLIIRQNAWFYVANLENDAEEFFSIPLDRIAYAISLGSLSWNDLHAQDGDGLFLSAGSVKVRGSGQAIIILQRDFDRASLSS